MFESAFKSFFIFTVGCFSLYQCQSTEDYLFKYRNPDLFNANDTFLLVFKHFDTNNNNLLSFNEFDNLLNALFINYQIPKDKTEAILNHYNGNCSENMRTSEFKQFWIKFAKNVLLPKSALIVVDVQNDFIDGSLLVPDGLKVVSVINSLLDTVAFDAVVYTMDWHPRNHCSFFENVNLRKLSEKSPVKTNFQLFDTVIFEQYPNADQKLWPTHCVQGSKGAELHPDLKIINPEKDEMKRKLIYTKKGHNPDIDSYSAFYDNAKLSETGLDKDLKEIGVTDIYLTGLAADVCVASTAIDGLTLKYRTVFVEDATRAVNSDDFERKKQVLGENGALIISSSEVHNMITGRDRRPELGYAIIGLNNQPVATI